MLLVQLCWTILKYLRTNEHHQLICTALFFHLSKILEFQTLCKSFFFFRYFLSVIILYFKHILHSRIYVPLCSFAIFYILLTLKSVSEIVWSTEVSTCKTILIICILVCVCFFFVCLLNALNAYFSSERLSFKEKSLVRRYHSN